MLLVMPLDLLLEKGAARGGKYFRRVPTGNPKRPWRYYYTQSDYEKDHGGLNGHLEGPRMTRARALVKLKREVEKNPEKFAGHERIWVKGSDFGLPKSTKEAHTKNGDYTEDRKHLHEAIVRKFTENVKPVPADKQPVAIVMMGGGGSGKGTIKKAVLGDYQDFVNVDPDEVKDEIPEYRDGLSIASLDGKMVTSQDAAFMAHQESSEVAKKIAARAREERKNVIIDGTGYDAVEYSNRIQKLKDSGYHVRLIYAHVDKDEAIARAAKRAERSGRSVPTHILEDAHTMIPGNFKYVAQDADEIMLMKSDIPPTSIFTAPPPHADNEEQWKAFQELGARYHKERGVTLPKREERLQLSDGKKPPSIDMETTLRRMQKNARKYRDADDKVHPPGLPWPSDFEEIYRAKKKRSIKKAMHYATPAGPVLAVGGKGPERKRKKKKVLVAKMSTMLIGTPAGARGDAPRQSIPDYGAIYFQPESKEKDRLASEASLNRRRSMRGTKFGFHGTSEPRDEPELRFVVEKDKIHGPQLAQRTPIVRAPRLVSSKDKLAGKLRSGEPNGRAR